MTPQPEAEPEPGINEPDTNSAGTSASASGDASRDGWPDPPDGDEELPF